MQPGPMSVVLLDTTVVSLPHPKKRRSEVLARYAVHMEKQTLALSFQSVAELWNWAEAREWGDEARNGLDRFIKRFLVIPYDYALARTWARAMQSSRKEGRRLDTGDCWIAATAIHRRTPLLTHDRDLLDLSIPGLQVISYLEPE